MRRVVALGGAISGEHGIGLEKTPILRMQNSPGQVKAMQAVKLALDPLEDLSRVEEEIHQAPIRLLRG